MKPRKLLNLDSPERGLSKITKTLARKGEDDDSDTQEAEIKLVVVFLGVLLLGVGEWGATGSRYTAVICEGDG